MKVVLVGCGEIGEALSKLLIKERHDVVVIEKSEKLAEELAERLDALVLHGDGSDKNILKDANIEKADVVFAVSGDDKTNLIACEFAKEAKVPNIIARLNKQESERLFARAGIGNIVNATETAVAAFKKAMERPGKQLVSLTAGGEGEIIEISIRRDSKLANKKVGNVSDDFIIACIYRDDKLLIPKPETEIKEGDILTICFPAKHLKKIEGMV